MAISFERLNKLSMVGKLALANFVIFICLHLLSSLHYFGPSFSHGQVVSFLGCPSSMSVLVEKPWTIISYSFTQFDPLHALLNILWLIWIGSLASQIGISQMKILFLYFAAAIVGGVTYVLASTLAGLSDSLLLGASASVISLAVAVAVTRPSLRISIPLLPVMPVLIPVSVIVLAEACIVAVGNPGGHFAHIGGIISGIIFGLAWRRHSPRTTVNVVSDVVKNNHDELFRKIRTSGYDSLSPDERVILFRSHRPDSTDNS